MDALSFRNALLAAKPEVNSLVGVGLSIQEAIEVVASFDLLRRSIDRENELPDPVLNDLFARFDASNVEIGMVRFCDAPEQTSHGYLIGQVEADYLALEAHSGEIVVRDVANPLHTIWKVARDGASLLAALAEAARYLGVCIITDQAGSNVQLQTFNRCTLLAGGEAYSDFYKMLLSLE